MPALVAGNGMRRTMYAATLRARPDTGGAEAPGAARSRARLKMNIAMVALARRLAAAGGTAGADYFVAGATAHLIFCAGDFVAAGAARDAASTQRCLIDMASKNMRWAARPATTGADFGAGDTHRLVRDSAA